MKYRLVLLILITFFFAIGLLFSCNKESHSSGERIEKLSTTNDNFVGDQECVSCHVDQYQEWEGSHHYYAMNPASERFVRADFNDVVFEHNGEQFRFYKESGDYFVEATTAQGLATSYEVAYTFGWEPLQQYLLDYGDGKYQALNIAWNTEEERWFALNPDQSLEHGDWLHWTGGAMNWNTMCADCHSTNLNQNYIPEADSFHTTWSSMNVSCESCHGGGKQHVSFMKSEEAAAATMERIRKDLQLTKETSSFELVNQCAPCHSLREKLTDDYKHEGNFLDYFNPTLPHPESYFADGQIKEEVYVYGSFLQSKMYKEEISCNDCHNPHSLELKANVTDNTLCMNCHESRYNSPNHHFHQINTEGAQCINCHMPGRYYMEVDFRRDHSFRVPRPDLSVLYETPNACNNCHEEKSAQWASEKVTEWYGSGRAEHFSETLLKADSLSNEALPELSALIADTSKPDIVRATAVWYAGQFPSQESLMLLENAAQSESPFVRLSAVRALSALPAEMKMLPLQDALDDDKKSIRLAAVSGLLEFTVADISSFAKQSYKASLEEYRDYLAVNRYFPEGEMNRGQFFEKRGEMEKALKAYQNTVKKDRKFLPARINLAYLYNQLGQNAAAEEQLQKAIELEPTYGPAHYSLALLKAEQNDLEEALSHFEKAAELMPKNHRLRYNWAISLQRLGMREKAEKIYSEAIDLAPENTDYKYGIVTLYIQQNEFGKALPQVQKLIELEPGNKRFQQLYQLIEEKIK